jgi:very-short-patch-repair endonuclease
VRAPILTLKRARALRRKMTLPEVILWQELRRDSLKRLRFRRQHPVGPYILDFCCSAARLAIEIDGTVHHDAQQSEHDERRDRWLAKYRIRVLRIAAADILNDERLNDVLYEIAQATAPSTACGGPPPPLCGGGTKRLDRRR